MIEVIPTILVKSREEFEKRLRLVEPFVDRVQWDIMDGVFVQNTTFSDTSVLKELLGSDPQATSVLGSKNKGRTLKLRVEADLMVADPQNWIGRFAPLRPHSAEASRGFEGPTVDRLIFHIESTSAPEVLIQDAKVAGFKVGLTLDPDTPLKQVWDYLGEIDLFQTMGVKSGWGGQKFIPEVLDRIGEVRRSYPDLPIAVDGGVNAETAPEIVAAGANILCAGSFIFDSDKIEEAIRQLREAGNRQ